MKKRLLMLVVAVGVLAGSSFTDFQCLNDCQRMGYTYSYCMKICSY